nr:hypothetical protein BgiMline_000831 [Biomphalaria glabrata]
MVKYILNIHTRTHRTETDAHITNLTSARTHNHSAFKNEISADRATGCTCDTQNPECRSPIRLLDLSAHTRPRVRGMNVEWEKKIEKGERRKSPHTQNVFSPGVVST